MPDIKLADLKSEDLDLFRTISAETPNGHAQLVWDNRRPLSMLHMGNPDDRIANRPGDLTQSATIKVESLAANDIDPILSKIEALDTQARRRIVRG